MIRLFVIIYGVSFLMACQSNMHFCKTASDNQSITEVKEESQDIVAMIAPYKEQLGEEMNEVIGTVAQTLTKIQPESTLGNWMTDVVQEQAKKYSKHKVDFTVLNYGGMRIPSLPKGDLSKGKIFELMPFDNYIVLVAMKGSELSLLFDHIAVKGGWPISRELNLVTDGKKTTQALLNGAKIDDSKIYYVATNNYLAKGGDRCAFFVGKEQIETGVLIRDALLEYVGDNKKDIDAKLEGRIKTE